MQKKIDIDLNQITTIFFDVDGVFTDGSLYFSDNGVNTTKFNVHDGMGCILLKETGIELVILTARHSDAVIQRFKGLGNCNAWQRGYSVRDVFDFSYNLFLISSL